MDAFRVVLAALLLLAISMSPTLAGVSVEYQVTPEILLPGDYADCTLKLLNPSSSPVDVKSIVIHGNGVTVAPALIYSVGTIPPQGSYTLPFSIKAEKVGRYNVEVRIYADNDTIVQNIMVVVDDRFPFISVEGPVYIGEVNQLRVHITSPIELKDVRVEAMFNASPRIVSLGSVEGEAVGVFKFSPSSEQELKFKISFYNGRNYHEVIRSLTPNYLRSKGVVLSATSPYRSLFVGDCLKVYLDVANLRGDEIFDVIVRSKAELGKFATNEVRLAKIGSGENRTVEFTYSPFKNGNDTLRFEVIYRDEFGEIRAANASLSVQVLDSLAVSLTNVEVRAEGLEITVSGDVSNNGHSTAYNVYATASCNGEVRDYYIGNVDPSDFQSFDLTLKCNKSLEIAITWSNEVGDQFRLTRTVAVENEVPAPPQDNTPLIVSGIVAGAVLVIVGYVVYRQVRKKE